MYKGIYILILISILFFGCQKEQKNTYKTTELQDGFPEALNPVERDLPFEILSHSTLESNHDWIDIYFGGHKQGNRSGHWIALAANRQLKMFRTIDFIQNPENEKDNIIDVDFNNSTNRVSLIIRELDTIENEITYSWIDRSTLTDSLTVLTIDRPLVKGKTFPALELTDINGKEYNLKNLGGNTVVLNWWAVWCAPCRKEIPGLNKLVRKYSDKKVKFVSITDDTKARVSKFLEDQEFNYDITFISENDRKVFGNSYPKNIVIDSSQTIIFYDEGGNEFVWQKIDRHLAESAQE